MQRNTDKFISYTADVLKEALRKEGSKMPYDKCLEAMNILFEYINFETLQKEVGSIEIPNLGKLYQNSKLLVNKSRDEENVVQNKLNEIQYFCDMNELTSIHKAPTISMMFEHTINKKFKIDKLGNRLSKIDLNVIAATEKLQNK